MTCKEQNYWFDNNDVKFSNESTKRDFYLNLWALNEKTISAFILNYANFGFLDVDFTQFSLKELHIFYARVYFDVVLRAETNADNYNGMKFNDPEFIVDDEEIDNLLFNNQYETFVNPTIEDVENIVAKINETDTLLAPLPVFIKSTDFELLIPSFADSLRKALAKPTVLPKRVVKTIKVNSADLPKAFQGAFKTI